MTFENNIFLSFIFVPIAIGIFVSVLLLIALSNKNKTGNLSMRSYVIGYGVCVAINVSVLIITMGFLLLPCYIIMFGPLMIFSFMLNKKLIIDKRLRNPFINLIYKIIVTLLIWFMAFFPFPLFGITKIANLPAEIAKNREILQFQEEISNFETYADLTPFGLGVYKLREKGDRLLWDVTKPKDYVINDDGIYMVYGNHYNRRDEETWDNSWGNSNMGKDVLYDVLFYEGTYIIITPLWEKPGTLNYWGYIYLCKDINKDADLFDVGILDPQVVEKLRELPGEKFSRKKLAEKLGKTF